MRALAFILLCVALTTASANAQPSARLPTAAVTVLRLNVPVTLDGVVSASEWNTIETLPLVTHWPTFGEPISKPTELRLAYDDDYLYFAARCYDTETPLATSYGRDQWGDADDQVALILDTFGDHENAVVFVLYSSGARIDAAVSDDARSGSAISTDWNTFWDGAVTRDEEGWYAEIRIPWSSLRFQPEPSSRVTMGALAYRYIPRVREMQIFPAVPAEWGFWSFAKPSQGHPIHFDGVRASRPLYVTPYATGGLGQQYRMEETSANYERTDRATYDVGFDLKYGLTSNLTLDATVNTDFAQVEADDQQINMTRFSLFFPEKRQFFLERTSNFDFSFSGNDRVFYSRRIGLVDGRQVPLLGGLRFVGRSGGWDVGLMTMQSARSRRLPSENFGVLRLKRQIFGPGSYVGGIATSRLAEDGSSNIVYGFDGVLNVRGDEYLLWNWAQSVNSEPTEALRPMENGRMRVLWQRAREEGLTYALGLSRSGAAYDPGLGFQLRHDFTQLSGRVGLGWLPEASSSLSRHRLALESNIYFRNHGGDVETTETTTLYDATWRSGLTLRAWTTYIYENLLSGFGLPEEAEVLPGRYHMVTGSAYAQMPGSRRFRPAITVEGGSFFDGYRGSILLSPTWSLSPKVKLSGDYGYDRARFPERNERFDAHVGRVRADMTFSTHVSLMTFVQVNSATDAVAANIRFRYNPREGRDLYLVYNEVFNADRYRLQPSLPLTDNRTVIVKYAHTFLW